MSFEASYAIPYQSTAYPTELENSYPYGNLKVMGFLPITTCKIIGDIAHLTLEDGSSKEITHKDFLQCQNYFTSVNKEGLPAMHTGAVFAALETAEQSLANMQDGQLSLTAQYTQVSQEITDTQSKITKIMGVNLTQVMAAEQAAKEARQLLIEAKQRAETESARTKVLAAQLRQALEANREVNRTQSQFLEEQRAKIALLKVINAQAEQELERDRTKRKLEEQQLIDHHNRELIRVVGDVSELHTDLKVIMQALRGSKEPSHRTSPVPRTPVSSDDEEAGAAVAGKD